MPFCTPSENGRKLAISRRSAVRAVGVTTYMSPCDRHIYIISMWTRHRHTDKNMCDGNCSKHLRNVEWEQFIRLFYDLILTETRKMWDNKPAQHKTPQRDSHSSASTWQLHTFHAHKQQISWDVTDAHMQLCTHTLYIPHRIRDSGPIQPHGRTTHTHREGHTHSMWALTFLYTVS